MLNGVKHLLRHADRRPANFRRSFAIAQDDKEENELEIAADTGFLQEF